MSSINPHYTLNYSQPEEYRFSHDSVFLARRVFEMYQGKDLNQSQALDLCAGCGIIGLDFLFHLKAHNQPTPKQFDFLEVQEIYKNHFQKNKEQLGPTPTLIQFLNLNYEVLLDSTSKDRYDLILSNPPYFHQNQGKLSPSEFKNRCRFFLDSDFKKLIRAIENSLKPQGEAFILLRDQREHGWNAVEETKTILSEQMTLIQLEDVRGTGLMKITKL